MAQSPTLKTRPDEDIEGDIEDIVAHYPPLANDRHYIKFSANKSVVTLSGHVKTSMNRDYLIANVNRVSGVSQVSAEGLYEDESIRLEVGRFIPFGVFARVEYGRVVLSGSVPQGASIDQLVGNILKISGVEKVVTTFK